MKKMLPLFLAALAGLAGCSKSNNDPQPAASQAQLVGTWSLDAEQDVTTPKNGGASTTTNKNITPGDTKLTFNTNGTYTTTYKGAAGASGTYIFSNNTLVVNVSGQTNSSTNTVKELTNNRLVLVDNDEDANNRYVSTSTFSR